MSPSETKADDVSLHTGAPVDARSRGSQWKAEPTSRELFLLWLATCLVFVTCVAGLRNYFSVVDNPGDASGYMAVASAIRHWDFHGIVVKQFWGLSYAMAALSLATGVSDRTALLLISFLSSLAGLAFASRLWGGWVSAFFLILTLDWLLFSYLGGAEPLFVALLFGSFFAVRKEHWLVAALLASLATVVRPLGVFALVGIGLVLLWKREYRKFLAAFAIGATIGVAYVLPLARHFGNPLATVSSYHSPEWQGGWLFGFPFYAIIKGTLTEPAPWTNLIWTFGWILLTLVALVVMLKAKRFREYARAHPVEMILLAPYLWCMFTYNYPHWARGNFPRFAIPIVPFLLLALDRWLPKDRRLLWLLAPLTSALAAASALGISNVPSLLRHALS